MTSLDRLDRLERVLVWVKRVANVCMGVYVIYTFVALSLLLGKLWGEGAVP